MKHDTARRISRRTRGMLITTTVLLLTGCTTPGERRQAGIVHDGHEQPVCLFTPAESVHCGRTPTSAFDREGRLWTAYVVGEHVYVSRSDDRGQTFATPVRVTAQAEPVYTNGENRPKVAFGTNGEIYLTWTKVMEGLFAGDIRFTRSLDGGRTFEPVRTINDDGIVTSHRFETMMVTGTGHIFIAWLDKRDMDAAVVAGREYNGAAVYYTFSTDNGATFVPNRKVADSSCECCRIAMSETTYGDAAIFWRHIYHGTTRDHGFAELGIDGLVTPAQRATFDNWKIEACPHHGPAMVTASELGYHISWFTLGDAHKGIYYGHYVPESGEIAKSHPVAGAGSGHPYLARVDQKLYLVWKQFDGEKTGIKLMISMDEGMNWQSASVVTETAGASDHPLLVTYGSEVYLGWHTANEGFHMMPLKQVGSIQ